MSNMLKSFRKWNVSDSLLKENMKIHHENKDEESNTCVLLWKPDKKILRKFTETRLGQISRCGLAEAYY
jgi:hypothetical protein